MSSKTDKEKVGELLTELGVEFEDNAVAIHCKEGARKVDGYSGFLISFDFTDSGEFISLGAWE